MFRASLRGDRVQAFRRRLFASVSVVSLILCLATVGLWAASYWLNFRIEQEATYGSPDGLRQVAVSRGRLAYIMYRYRNAAPGWLRPAMRIGDGSFYDTRPFGDDWDSLPGSHVSDRTFSLEYFEVDAFAGHAFTRKAMIPLWLPALLCALVPAYWLLGPRRRVRRRRTLGLCQQCGYDLRATPGRCAECGRSAAMV